MFVHKKYPKVAYTMTVELTQEEVERIMREGKELDEVVWRIGTEPHTVAPTICDLFSVIRQEARLPYGC